MEYNAPQKYRAETYAESRRIYIDFTRNPLGSGTDGVVFESSRQTAVKVFERPKEFLLEKTCYQRLQARQIIQLAGFSVPRLHDFDDGLLVIEMNIVRPPYVLDFGKVSLDRAPDFSPEVMAERHEHWASLFDEHWRDVKKVMSALRAIGIHYLDPKPGNIMPANWNPTI